MPIAATRADASRIGLAAILALALVSLAVLAWTQKRHEIAGVGTFWSLDDDMMITLRYARNAAAGDGLVWNRGERVEGITNLLWALLLVPPHWVFPERTVAFAAIALDVVLVLAAIVLLFALVRRIGGSRIAAFLAALALAIHHPTLHWAVAGSEAILLAVLLLVVAHAVASPQPSERALRGACLAAGLAWITRPDAGPAIVALLAWPIGARLAAAGARASGLRLVLLLALLPAAAIAFRLAYYGSPLPNTYWLKMTGWSGRLEVGLRYAGEWMGQHAGHVLFALLGPFLLAGPARRVTGTLVAAVVLHALYVVSAGGDELMRQRFFVPVTPLLLAASLAGIDALAMRLAKAGVIRSGGQLFGMQLGLRLALFAFGAMSGRYLPGMPDPEGAKRAAAEKHSIMLGLLIRANTPPEAKAAHFWAGATPYFSKRPAIDLLGKCDPVIARQPARHGLTTPGHNKYDFPHSLGLEPDLIVGGIGGAASLELAAAFAKSSPYRAFADLYFAPGFAPHYVRARPEDVGVPERMPQLVGGAGTTLPPEYVEILRGWHAIFVRAGSPRVRPPEEWVAPTREDLR